MESNCRGEASHDVFPRFIMEHYLKTAQESGRQKVKAHNIIATSRLMLTRVDQSGREFFGNYLADPLHTLYLPKNRPYTLEESDSYYWQRLKHWRDYGFGIWLFRLRGLAGEDTEVLPVGFCGLEYVADSDHIDLRYGVDRKYQGHAFGFEAAGAILTEGFGQLALHEIYGVAEHDNIASLCILKKLGMYRCYEVKFYGSMVKYFKIDREKWDKISQVVG